jgi:RNA polymerase sigma-70 factor (ECF subfamily)
VYGLAARVTGDRAAAEDVTQEVFLHLWERPWVFDPDRGRLRAWLATMGHHRSADLLRRAEVRDRYATRAATARDPASPPNPEEAAVAAAVAKRVRVAVEELPAPQRTAVLLAYFEAGPSARSPASPASPRARPSPACASACATSPTASSPKASTASGDRIAPGPTGAGSLERVVTPFTRAPPRPAGAGSSGEW